MGDVVFELWGDVGGAFVFVSIVWDHDGGVSA